MSYLLIMFWVPVFTGMKILSHAGDCVVITFLSFRASEARHGIQYFQHVLDTDLRRYDDGDGFFTIATQSPGGGGLVVFGFPSPPGPPPKGTFFSFPYPLPSRAAVAFLFFMLHIYGPPPQWPGSFFEGITPGRIFYEK
jgi:hypothetical protein